MKMTLEQMVDDLQRRVAMLESRVVMLEARNMTYGPLPSVPPTNPWPLPNYPWQPPYTITCKAADGTTHEMFLNGPIVAQNK